MKFIYSRNKKFVFSCHDIKSPVVNTESPAPSLFLFLYQKIGKENALVLCLIIPVANISLVKCSILVLKIKVTIKSNINWSRLWF